MLCYCTNVHDEKKSLGITTSHLYRIEFIFRRAFIGLCQGRLIRNTVLV